MSSDRMYPSFCQAPATHWQTIDAQHYAMPMSVSGHLGAMHVGGGETYMNRSQTQTQSPMSQSSSNQMPQQQVQPKRQRSNANDSGGSEKACSSDEAARILEERRRRNANASARFRKRRNERERELVMRCMFLENQLLQAVGSAAFETTMRKAPPIERNLLNRHSGVGIAEDEDDSPSPVSVCALTAPKSIDDVWTAYLQLSEQVAGAVERIDALESSK
ncbi:hypothetical protein COEREDRAFT_6717 [Coemansia reversa NRRL 1564]|uniref:BZIP domain-containing protein n=1 Tax=Coemansia reversa (strain ATCC 12441 / NRRL 1564) TaxID=763665 RepID=A0A2G5BHI2_COERN|nr:hypothetical protein COEREDRAFT_6717 [Coemansia reversa NRRL 1564]|eukprot:PIA18486.1 hypothetical protein COEREDRAFT_6717 [Coemansia reversa NRRL 1564]